MKHKIEHGDALELMAAMEDREASVIITDPPYSPHVHGNSRRGGGVQAGLYGQAVDLQFDPLDPSKRTDYAKQFARVARRWVVVFTDVEGVSGWITSMLVARLEYVRTCFWHKPNGTPQFTGDRPASHVEAIVVGHVSRNGKPMRKEWNGGGRSNVFSHGPVMGDHRAHKTQKPLRLMLELVELFSNPGELVLDPFAGSGSTGVACKQLGRKFLGFEIDEGCAAVARTRIEKTRADLPFVQMGPL